MKKFNSWLTAAFVLFAISFSAAAQAQEEEFRPYKGICWGMFWDQEVQYMNNTMVPVEYIRTGVDQYVFPNFLDCGQEVVLNIVGESTNEGYYDIELEMEGGQYDDYGYFYPPFNAGDYKWSFTASNGEIVGPILQPYSYFYEDLEYIGFFYVRYPQTEFAYFDIKTQEDYYEGYPRTYLDEEENPDGITEMVRPALIEDTYYNLQGRIATAAEKGIKIEGGRKVIR